MMDSALDTLRQHRPEWAPWLYVVDAMQTDIESRAWDDVIPEIDDGRTAASPVLANASITVDEEVLRRTVSRIMGAARACAHESLVRLSQTVEEVADTGALFVASLCDDRERVADLTGAAQNDLVHSMIALFAMPFLHACRRRWRPSHGSTREAGAEVIVAADWTQAYCPICAAWPAFVEMCGIERSRHARCGRCGAGWHAPMLKCGNCGTSAHAQLATLVPQSGRATGVIEACTACGTYTKTLTALQGCPPASVYIEDLTTVALDVAALDAGFVRPHGLGYPLRVTTHVRPATRRLQWWATS